MATCPYCNSPLPVAAAGARTFCTRCGEAVPERFLQAAAGSPADVSEAPPAVGPAAPPRRQNVRATAAVVLGVMATMAVVAATFAWMTVGARRANDRRSGVVNRPPEPLLVAADELDALRYLPPHANLVVGLDLAAARQAPLGEQLLARLTGKDGQAPGLDAAHWTGLDADEIDHAVLGASLTDKGTQTVLVVHTRRPYDFDRLREKLKATRSVDSAGKKVYPYHPERLSFGAPALWSPTDRVLVIGFTHFDLDAVPNRPAPAADALAPPVRRLLHDRVGVGSFAWVAGELPEGDLLGAVLALAVPNVDAKAIGGVRTFAVGCRAADGLTVQGEAQCRDAAAAEALVEKGPQLQALLAPVLQKVSATPEGRRLGEALLDGFTHQRQEAVVIFETHADAETVRQALRPRPAP